ncbi:hypothetical protein BDK51DRAFT_39883 [Blyttiomyces helicus]|uniref:Peroxisome assembly protein 22 n=1 Tax=Blyttiomyces helicus TaxID=388810 RepID=A0A4V1IQH3_9FUNG|nr:hypothetical protein BDK51DRAFT_39883 [Blyttiomyces helicus]|eukprot:RKO86557.1 hypothetical protein BDK51DRAFT_39883 [Blyttiomyces helicus]
MSAPSRRSKILASAATATAIVAALGGLYLWWSKSSPPRDQRSPSAAQTAVLPPSKTWRGVRETLTLSLKNIALWNPSPDPLHPNHAFLESVVPFLHSLVSSPRWQVHLLMVVTCDEEEVQIRELLSASGLYTAGLDPRRVLFCGSEEGKACIVRALEPAWHVDGDDDCVRKLAAFVPNIVRVRGRGGVATSAGPLSGVGAKSVGGGVGSPAPRPLAAGHRRGELSRSGTFSSLQGAVTPPPSPATSASVPSSPGPVTERFGASDNWRSDPAVADLLKLGNVRFVNSLTESLLI